MIWRMLSLALLVSWANVAHAQPLELSGVTVTPHVQSKEMRYRRDPDFSLGARVQVFIRNAGDQALSLPAETEVRLRGRTPAELLQAGEWAWHDLPGAWTNELLTLPPGALTVWSWNGHREAWGTNTAAELTVCATSSQVTNRLSIEIANPHTWLSAVTFLGAETNPFPDSLIFHVANETEGALRLEACGLWLPKDNASWRALLPQPWKTNLTLIPADGVIECKGLCAGCGADLNREPCTCPDQGTASPFAALKILKDTE